MSSGLPAFTDLWDWPDTPGNRQLLLSVFNSCRYPSYGMASITKRLHLKGPRLVCPIDSRLWDAWIIPNPQNWLTSDLVDVTFEIGWELRARRTSLRRLKTTADSMGWPFDALSILRLYDIVSWWECQ